MAATSAIFKGAYTKLLTSLGLGLEAGQKIKYTDGAAVGAVPVSDAQGVLSLGTATSITAAGADSNIQYNNGGVFGGDAALVWDDVNKRLGVSVAAPLAQVHVVTDSGATQSSHELSPTAYAYRVYSNTASTRPQFRGMRYRGTYAIPTTVVDNDRTFSFQAFGYDGANAQSTASLNAYVDGAVSAGVVPMRFVISTGTTNATTDRIIVKSDGKVGIGNSTPGATLHTQSLSAATITEIVQGASSQTANLQEWQNSSSSALASVTAAGAVIGQGFGVGVSIPASILDLRGTATSMVRLGNTTVTAADGIGSQLFTFHVSDFLCGIRMAYTGGTAVANRSITFFTAGDSATPKMILTGQGRLGIGTTTPGSRVHASCGATTDIGIISQGFAGQTADLQQWQDSTSAVVASVCALGCAKFTGLQLGIRSISSAPTITPADYTLVCDATAAGFTVTLPAAATNTGRIFNIKKVDSSVNAVTIDGNGAETIDGAATLAITTQWTSIKVQCTGTAWIVI